MKIRKVTSEDIKQITKLYVEEMGSSFKAVGEKAHSSREYEKILRKSVEPRQPHQIYVLLDPNIKGFLWFYKEGNQFFIEEIIGRGYGKQLMHFLLEKAKKARIKKINLCVHFKNKKAITFYRKFNFTPRTIEMSKEIR